MTPSPDLTDLDDSLIDAINAGRQATIAHLLRVRANVTRQTEQTKGER